MEAGTREQEGQRRAAFKTRGEGDRSGASRREAPRKPLLPPLREGPPPPAAINGNSGEVASYYLGNRHKLIHRHTESMAINADQSARWTLRIDFELPEKAAARCGEHNGEWIFLFPLLFLRKAQGRTGFEARDERGDAVPLLNRELSDKISGRAAAKAAVRLIEEAQAERPDLPDLSPEKLKFVFERICGWRPYIASVTFNKLKHELDDGVLEAWEEEGLIEDLELLVDHSLVWVPLRGLPGERRVIEVAHDTELLRRPLLRWHFGELEAPKRRLRWWRRRDQEKQIVTKQVLDTGDAVYGRTARRLSLSVVGERLAQPIGWMPIEFDFPTIYTRRCDSYHFEMTCPGGLKPRGVRVALDQKGNWGDSGDVVGSEEESGEEKRRRQKERRKRREEEGRRLEEEHKRLEEKTRTTIRNRAAHVYLPGGRDVGDVVLRATVGISGDAFPILWVLMGTITTIMLWSLVAFNPYELVHGDPQSQNEIAAGVLLIVPALLGAIIIGSDEKAESKLLSGARILLLVTGLCCAGAAAVFTGIDPISDKPQATWAVCATIATAAMIPLLTSWLLSIDALWRGREALNTAARQYAVLSLLAALAFGLALLLPQAGGDTFFRAALASCFLLLSVALILLASNRLPVALEANRKFVSVGAMILAVACLVLACVQLQRISAPDARWQIDVESVEQWILIFAPSSGLLLWAVTLIFGPRPEELSVSPAVGKGLIRWERIGELRRLREVRGHSASAWARIVEDVKSANFEPGNVTVGRPGRTEGDWKAEDSSSTVMPEFVRGEFGHLIEHGAEGGRFRVGDVDLDEWEKADFEALAKQEGTTVLDVELAYLKTYVEELLEEAGKDRKAGLVSRIASRFPRRG